MIQVILETPQGSRNKYAFDPELKIFELKKVLPAGMSFFYDSDSCLQPKRSVAIRWTSWC